MSEVVLAEVAARVRAPTSLVTPPIIVRADESIEVRRPASASAPWPFWAPPDALADAS
jgi:hypothetical protein